MTRTPKNASIFEEPLGRTVVVTASTRGEGERLFASKKSFGEPYACKQTTALASLAHSIRGEATKESENRRLIRQKRKIERFASQGRTVVVTASLCPRRRSVEFCDDCPHFLLPSSPTGRGRRKCSRTLNSVPGEGECPLWQQKRTPIRCPFLLAE